MKRELPAWIGGLAVGAGLGTVLWMAIDTAVPDTNGIGMALSAALTLVVTHLRTAKVQKRRAWLASEAVAMSPTRVS
jgi:hypothetical protein